MQDDVTYNQLIIVKKNAFIKCQLIKKSFTEKGQLILILDDSQKIIFSGNGQPDFYILPICAQSGNIKKFFPFCKYEYITVVHFHRNWNICCKFSHFSIDKFNSHSFCNTYPVVSIKDKINLTDFI